MKSDERIAFVIDSLPSIGGGERVLFTALEVFPNADVFTLIYNKPAFKTTPLANLKIKTSFIDRIPFAHTHHRMFLPLMPFAIEQFNLRAYDIIVSFSYAVAHGAQNHDGARHVSYTYTPMRYAWTELNINGTHTRKNPILEQFMRSFRRWDKRAASRIHQFATISQAVSRRIQHAYQREASIIYPPVETNRFIPTTQREAFYITVTRLVAHKRVDIIVQAFTQLGLPLLIIGEGPELHRLKSMAGSNIQFLGYQSDGKVSEYLGKARGFVCATEEDFGIAIVEAQAAGCPVIAYGQGGALETVVNGVTGLFFQEQSAESLMEAVSQFENRVTKFNVDIISHNVQRFSKRRFMEEFQNFVKAGNK
jgi:glycosyltransferase involved in cell wall biosynthesis